MDQKVEETAKSTANTIGETIIDYPVDVKICKCEEQSKTDINDDEIIYLTIDSPALKCLKLFLLVTLQKIPKEMADKYQLLLHCIQIVLTLAVFVCYLHVLGTFGEKTLVEEEMKLTLTSFKNIFWNLRNPILAVLGFLYFKKTHFDDMLSNLRLTSRCLRSVKWRIKLCCVLEVVFTVVLPACTKLVQMLYLPTAAENKKPFTKENAIMNVVWIVLARLLALPIVITFISEFYLLYYHVRQYKKKIKTWSVGQQQKARNYFLDIQKELKNAEKAFQPFLIIHIGILVLIFVPSILCYVERFNSEGSYKQTHYTTQDNKMYDPTNNLVGAALSGVDWTNLNLAETDQKNLTNKPVVLLIQIPQRKNTTTTYSERGLAKRHITIVQDKKAQARIVLEALTFLGELLALYLPIILLGRINNVLLHLPETIRFLNFDEQSENGYLFQRWLTVKEMLRDFENAQGLHILGMQLTFIKALLVALLAPFMTLLFHILVKHVDIT